MHLASMSLSKAKQKHSNQCSASISACAMTKSSSAIVVYSPDSLLSKLIDSLIRLIRAVRG